MLMSLFDYNADGTLQLLGAVRDIPRSTPQTAPLAMLRHKYVSRVEKCAPRVLFTASLKEWSAEA